MLLKRLLKGCGAMVLGAASYAQTVPLTTVPEAEIEDRLLEMANPVLVPFATNGQSGANAGETVVDITNGSADPIQILILSRTANGGLLELAVDAGDGRGRLQSAVGGSIPGRATARIKSVRGMQSLKTGALFIYASDPENLAVEATVSTGLVASPRSFTAPALEPAEGALMYVRASAKTSLTLINPWEIEQVAGITLVAPGGKVICAADLELAPYERASFDPLERLRCPQFVDGTLAVRTPDAAGIFGLAVTKNGDQMPLNVFYLDSEFGAIGSIAQFAAKAKPACVPQLSPRGFVFDAEETSEDYELDAKDCGDAAPAKWQISATPSTFAYLLDSKERKVSTLYLPGEGGEFKVGVRASTPSLRGGTRSGYVRAYAYTAENRRIGAAILWAFKQRIEKR